MELFRTQLKYVLRRLRHSPMFAAMTLVTLGIGIGANSAIFSVVNGICSNLFRILIRTPW